MDSSLQNKHNAKPELVLRIFHRKQTKLILSDSDVPKL